MDRLPRSLVAVGVWVGRRVGVGGWVGQWRTLILFQLSVSMIALSFVTDM